LGHLGLLVDEDRPTGLQVADDVEVVDDLLAHVHGRPVEVECLLDRLDGTLDAGAIAARRRQENLANHALSVAAETKRPAARGVVAAGPFVIAHRGLWPGRRAAVRIAQWGQAKPGRRAAGIGRTAHLCKSHARPPRGVPFAGPAWTRPHEPRDARR